MSRPLYIINRPPVEESEDLRGQLSKLTKAYNDLLMQLNQSMLRIGTRFDRIEKVAVSKPPSPRGLSAEGRQGSFHVTWEKVIGIDGYVLCMSSDSDGRIILARVPIHDHESIYWQFPVGNSATTRYFQIWSVLGNQLSEPSEIVSATSVSFGAGESAPTTPPQNVSPPSGEKPSFGVVGSVGA